MAYLKLGKEIPTSGKGSKLSARMITFIDEYMVDLNATAAVQRAGYKNQNPNRLATDLLHHPLIRQEIEKRMEERRERNVLSADYIINKLIDITENTEKGNPQAALRALELLGKTLSLFKDRQEISGPDGKAIEYEQRLKRDQEDLASAIARLVERNGTSEVAGFSNTGTEG